MVDDTRTGRKRAAIRTAARTLFLRQGYQGTSMDEIAALAAVSKQTVYKQFTDKELLFTEIVLGTLDQAGGPFLADVDALAGTDDLAADLHALARRYLAAVLRPEVLRLRRMVIGEAHRLRELARAYYDRAPERTLAGLADSFGRLAGRGLLRAADPELAATHFAFLVLGRPLDRALFLGDDDIPDAAELARLADAAADVFLAAYGAPT
ncbi:MAG TPA: TetR/AcrR family transcriptional regulator [Pseudonocardiaceae bacterium]|nr:TetR/AcrR family transcriptional regulator [Pseudonocardiaceae bacterium]